MPTRADIWVISIPGNSLNANTCSRPMERGVLSAAGLGFCHINSGARLNIQAEDIAP